MNQDIQDVQDEVSFAIEPEFVLLVGGFFLTVVVLIFVFFLIRTIIKEERNERQKSIDADGKVNE